MQSVRPVKLILRVNQREIIAPLFSWFNTFPSGPALNQKTFVPSQLVRVSFSLSGSVQLETRLTKEDVSLDDSFAYMLCFNDHWSLTRATT